MTLGAVSDNTAVFPELGRSQSQDNKVFFSNGGPTYWYNYGPTLCVSSPPAAPTSYNCNHLEACFPVICLFASRKKTSVIFPFINRMNGHFQTLYSTL
jgi:hypothetical protein